MAKANQRIKIKELEKKLGFEFNDFDLLENAFIHRSYLNENGNSELSSNERLEFLGDAVLELSVTDYLYKHFEKPEGELTSLRSALVRGKNLSRIASNLGFYNCLYLSEGEKKGSEKAKNLILANCFEAVIGAIYLDLGFGVASDFINKEVTSNIDEIIQEKLYIDSKSQYQEIVQDKIKLTPRYEVIEEEGPDHAREFTAGVFVGEKMIASGKGLSKSQAEQDAAQNALKLETTSD